MSLDELKLPKNNLFKLTCRDGHDNPNYTFTWELTPEGARVLQEKKVRFPFMYVFAVEEIPPNRNESHSLGCGCDDCTGYHKLVEDHLFCLHEGAGQIQFHRQGTFKIYAIVIWYDDDLLSSHSHTWRVHRAKIRNDIGSYRSRVLDGVGVTHVWSLDHVEEDAVQITSSFFAEAKPYSLVVGKPLVGGQAQELVRLQEEALVRTLDPSDHGEHLRLPSRGVDGLLLPWVAAGRVQAECFLVPPDVPRIQQYVQADV